MTDLPTFALAVLALLAVPGPTNTLLAAAGAAAGVRRALRLLPAEVGGYLIAIGFLTQAVAPLLAGLSMASAIAAAVAGCYLLWLAWRLWRDPDTAAPTRLANPIRFRDVFLTTLLNPKALVFSFVIFPPGDTSDLLPLVAVFSLLVVGCGASWVLLGDAIRRSSGGRVTGRRVAQASAVALAAFAAILAWSAARQLLA